MYIRIFITFILVAFTCASTDYSPCEPPTDEGTILTDLLRQRYNDFSFVASLATVHRTTESHVGFSLQDFIAPSKRIGEINTENSQPEYDDVTALPRYMETSCPVMYTLNSDVDRYPENITEARCECRHCVHFSNEDCDKPNGCFSLNGVCKRIMTVVPVIRKYCDLNTGLYDYEFSYERIAIGCTCMRSVHVKS